MKQATAEQTTEKHPAADLQAPGELKESVRFNDMFNKNWHCSICADNKAEANIIDSPTIQEMAKSGSDCITKPLLRPLTFTMAANLPSGNFVLVCTQSAIMDVGLHICHGTVFILSGEQWLVTKQEVGEPLSGQPLLDSMGLHTRDMLAAAAERHGGSVDVSAFDAARIEHVCIGRIARIVEEIYHADEGAEDADLEDN